MPQSSPNRAPWAPRCLPRGTTIALSFIAAVLLQPGISSAAGGNLAVIPIHGDHNAAEKSFSTAVRDALAAANLPVFPSNGSKLLRKAHLRGPQLLKPAAARKFGRRARLGSVLLVQAQRGNRMTCILVDLSTGRTVGQWQDLDGNDSGANDIAQKVAGTFERGNGAPAAEPAESSDAAESKTSKVSGKHNEDNGVNAAPADDAAASDGDTDSPATDGDTNSSNGGHGAWRPAFRLSAGVMGLQRRAVISPSGAATNESPPCYCSAQGHSNPFFPAFVMSLEVFPLAFHGHGGAAEGIGVVGEAMLSQVSSNVAANPSQSVVSFLSAGKIGATYRWVFGSTPLSPDLYLGLGYSLFSFPLAAGQFPGISYSSVYIGGALHVPLFMEHLIGIAILNVKPALSLGSGVVPTLGTSGSGLGIDASLGIRLALDRFELSLLGRIDFYSTSFKGSTALQGADIQFNNVGLSDRMLEGLLTVGVVF